MNHKGFKDRTGEISYNTNGERIEIIRYGEAKDIDVLFDDGFISYNKEYQSFKGKNGGIRNLNTYIHPTGKRFDRTGEQAINKQGLTMKILNYRMANDFDVIFEYGIIIRNKTYAQFTNGDIFNYNYDYTNSNFIDRTGEVNVNTDGQEMTILKYHGYHNVDVKFEDGYIYKHADYGNFKLGNIKNPLHKNIFGIGYLGDGERNKTTTINGVVKQSYVIWRAMLQRCYDEKTQLEYPTYVDCKVCNEWHCYISFEKWYENNYYEIKNEKMCLDKDWLIKNNNIYSPHTCIFVPEYINVLITSKTKTIESLPIGVALTPNQRYSSNIGINNIAEYLGTYDSPKEAFIIYKQAKEKHIKQIADEYKDKIPKKLYEVMYAYQVEFTD